MGVDMDRAGLKELLSKSLDDRHLSRGERQAIAVAFDAIEDDEVRRLVRRDAFDAARAVMVDPDVLPVLDWLQAVVDALQRPATVRASAPANEAHFSPGQTCYRRIIALFDRAERSADVCVFTITDDRISDAVLAAHARGVAVRIITDNEKADDLGSDIVRFDRAGIPVRVDRTSFHMHHKFAIFDGRLLLTGSYNWTRGAAEQNEENFIVSPDRPMIEAFSTQFTRLWERLG